MDFRKRQDNERISQLNFSLHTGRPPSLLLETNNLAMFIRLAWTAHLHFLLNVRLATARESRPEGATGQGILMPKNKKI